MAKDKENSQLYLKYTNLHATSIDYDEIFK